MAMATIAAPEVTQGSATSLLGDEFLTPDALARELGKSPRTLARWNVLRCGPPKIRVGRSVYYRRTSVRQWLESREENQNRAKARK